MYRSRWWSALGVSLLLCLLPASLCAQTTVASPGELLVLAAAKKKKRRSTSRPRPRFAVSSYGNPAAKDHAEGEEPVVREVAEQALGK